MKPNLHIRVIPFVLFLLLSSNLAVAAVKLDESFLKSNAGNSSVWIPVEQLIEEIRSMRLGDGNHPKIIGWQRKGNNYTFTFIAANKVVLKFTHLLNTGGKWSSVTALIDGKSVDASALIMQITTSPRDKTKAELQKEVDAKKDKLLVKAMAFANLSGKYRSTFSGESNVYRKIDVSVSGDKLSLFLPNIDCQILDRDVPITDGEKAFVADYNDPECNVKAIFSYSSYGHDKQIQVFLDFKSRGNCGYVCNDLNYLNSMFSYRKKDYSISEFFIKAMEAKKKGDFISAVEIYEKAASNSPEASYLLGKMYLNGEGVRQNIKTAANFFCNGSEHGDANSTVEIMNLLKSKDSEDDEDFPCSPRNWNSYVEIAAKQGHAQVQYIYANQLLDKAKLEIDKSTREGFIAKANFYLHKSAGGGYKEAIEQLGRAN